MDRAHDHHSPIRVCTDYNSLTFTWCDARDVRDVDLVSDENKDPVLAAVVPDDAFGCGALLLSPPRRCGEGRVQRRGGTDGTEIHQPRRVACPAPPAGAHLRDRHPLTLELPTQCSCLGATLGGEIALGRAVPESESGRVSGAGGEGMAQEHDKAVLGAQLLPGGLLGVRGRCQQHEERSEKTGDPRHPTSKARSVGPGDPGSCRSFGRR